MNEIRWKALLLTLLTVVAADLSASLQTGLTLKQTGTHLAIAVLGTVAAFFQRHQKEEEA